jgi:hypothetical protein
VEWVKGGEVLFVSEQEVLNIQYEVIKIHEDININYRGT